MAPRSPKAAPDDEFPATGATGADDFDDLAGTDDEQFRDSGAASIHATHAANLSADRPVHDVADTPWKPPSNLDAPPPRPGMSQRWIRVAANGEDDHTNLAGKLREGWQPRRSDTVPAGYTPPTIAHGKYAGCIGVGGMVLVEMPATRSAERTAYYSRLADRQMDAVTQSLANAQEPGHPIGVTNTRTISRRPSAAP